MLNESLLRFGGVGGFICASTVNEEIGVTWNDHYFKNVNDTNEFIEENKNINNCYVGIATYNKPWRTQENINIITAHYVDIDNHLNPFSLDQAKRFERAFLRPLYERVIPTPSQVLYTGRGLQLLFNLKGARDIPKFRQTQQALNETLQKEISRVNALINVGSENKLEVDNLTDIRVLRVANTINTKSRTYSKVIYSSNSIYTQDEIISRYGGLEYVTGAKKKQVHQLKELQGATSEEILKISDSKVREFKPYNQLYTLETINLYRRKDLKKLIQLRNAKGYTQGYRNKLISIVVQLLKTYITDSNELYNTLQDYNQEFKEPLKDSEILAWCRSAVRKQIYFKTTTIINALSITEEEQEQLSTLISHKVRNKRYSLKHREEIRQKRNERYKPVKIAHTKKLNKRNKKVLSLIEQGYTYKQIALSLDITKLTVQRIKNNNAKLK